MFLYDKKEKTIDVYSMIPKKEEIVNYKIDEMKKIPEEEKVVCARLIQSVDIDKNDIFLNRINLEMIKSRHLHPVLEISKVLYLLESYYLDFLVTYGNFSISSLDGIKHYLTTKNSYTIGFQDGANVGILGGIIQIPETLYILQLLKEERFDLLTDKDISSQLDLFDIKFVKDVNLEELEKASYCGMVPLNSHYNAIIKAKNDSKIMKFVKEKKTSF